MALPGGAGAAAAAAAASPMVLMEQGRVGVGRRPVGVSWIGQEHLLVTSPSQVVLYSVHDGGARLREWSFRPSKATAFTTPALAASQQGLLLGVQGPGAKHARLAAWPDKASLTAAGASGPEGLRSVEVGFGVARLVAPQGPAGVAWCLGGEGEGGEASAAAATRVACFATCGAGLSPLGASSSGARIVAALPSRRRPLLLAAGADGSVRAFVAAAAAPGEEDEAAPGVTAAAPPLRESAVVGVAPPAAGAALLRSGGLMWASGREESAFHWTVWATPAGGVHVRVARVSLAAGAGDGRGPPALTSAVLYGKDVGAEAAAGAGGAAGRKRPRRGSVASVGEATAAAGGGSVEVVGLEGEGALVVVDRSRGVLQAWDAQHGVALGEAALAGAAAAAGGGTWVVGEGGVLACVGEAGEVAVWRVEARAGAGEGGLRRVLGKGLLASSSAAAGAAGASAHLGAVLVFRGGEWVEEQEQEKQQEKGKKGGGSKQQAAGGGEGEDEVGALLRLVAAAPDAESRSSGGGGSSGSGKWGKARGPLARVPVSARTALLVARRCLDEEESALSTPARASGGGSNKRQKKASNPSGDEAVAAPLWRLLGALLDAGRLPLRERPFLMEELLERGHTDLVRRVLAGPADVPERAVVRALQRALALQQQQQEEGTGGPNTNRVAASLELVALAVRRPCCPAFLRTALGGELDGPSAALLLVLLKVLLERAVKGGSGARPGEEQCLTWLEALLDANFVNLVLEGAASASASSASGSVVRLALEGVKGLAGEAAAACQALETVGGYVAQFRRAGHAMEVIPDYSVDRLVI